MRWAGSADDLVRDQELLGLAQPPPWAPPAALRLVAGCFVCFPRGLSGAGRRGDPAWACAALCAGERAQALAVVTGEAGAPYEPGLLALREGPLLESAVRALPEAPEVVLVNATGRDHPRGAGLATHLGAVLDLPTVGVTDRPLLATGAWPGNERGASSPLVLDGEVVGRWVRLRRGARPVAVHCAWRTDVEAATDVVRRTAGKGRTPEPIRRARRGARLARGAEWPTVPGCGRPPEP